MNELLIIKLFLKNSDLFKTYSKDIKNIILEKEIQTLFNTVTEYYTKYTEHEYIGKAEFLSFFEILYSNIKDKSLYYELIEKIYGLEVSDSLIKDYVLKLLEKDYANRIITKLMPILEEDRSNILSSVEEDINSFKACMQQSLEDHSIFVEDDIVDLLEAEVHSAGINWRLQCLQDSLGPLRGGTLGHVFARPNTGKSTFLCSEVSNFARQLADNEIILWVNNEERGKKVRLRMFNAVLNASTETIQNDPDRAREVFIARGGNKIKLHDNALVSIADLHRLCEIYKPRMLIIDQGDKISYAGDKKLEVTERLRGLYVLFREIAKYHNIDVITVGQASAEAHGKKWLQDIYLDYSRTAKSGEMDYIIGIGKTYDGDDDTGIRYINIPKNKFKNRHDKHCVLLDAERARYSDLV